MAKEDRQDRPYVDDNNKVHGCDKCPFEFKCQDFCRWFAYPLAESEHHCILITDPREIEAYWKSCEHNPDTDTPADENTVASDSSDFLEWLDDDDDTGAGPTKKPGDDKNW